MKGDDIVFGMNQPIQPPQMQPLPAGRWLTVRTYQEVQSAPIPVDGSAVIFMLESEPVIYIASMVNGQKCISTFSITPLVYENQQQQQVPQPTIEERVGTLEASISELANYIKEAIPHESDTKPTPRAVKAKQSQ